MEGEIELPGGIWHDGTRHLNASLRPLSGADQTFLVECCQGATPAERTTALLARCVYRLGPLTEISGEAVWSLTCGDREALLLQLYRSTFGDALDCEFHCPEPACREKLELTLSADELLLPKYAEWTPSYQMLVEDDGETYDVRFRLPTGADQESVAGFAVEDPERAASTLLARCIEEVRRVSNGAAPLAPEHWPAAVERTLAKRLESLDPQAELNIRMTCPACGTEFSALLDAGIWLYEDTAQRFNQLYREVHWVAFHYHWSEREILSLTPAKRGLYLHLIAETLDREAAS